MALTIIGDELIRRRRLTGALGASLLIVATAPGAIAKLLKSASE